MATIKAPKKLIEVALPLDAINAAAAREKSIRHGHPSTLHLWWARRPLAAARAVLFAQMVNDPGYQQGGGFRYGVNKEKAALERERLFKIIEDLVKWENSNNEEVLDRARAEIRRSWRETCELNKNHPRADELFDPDSLPGFHDPFAGGGAIPAEAQRLGVRTFASDLNPVAVAINKAMTELPWRFLNHKPVGPVPSGRQQASLHDDWSGTKGLAEDVRRYGRWMRDEASKRILQHYPRIRVTAEMAAERDDLKGLVGQELTIISWLWARSVKSPNPAFSHANIPLTSTFVISKKPGNEAYVVPVVSNDTYEFQVRIGTPPADAEIGTKSGGSGSAFVCLLSKSPVSFEYIREEAKSGRMGQRLMAVVAEGQRGRVFLSPTHEQELASKIDLPTEARPQTSLPDRALGFRVQAYGMRTYGDLFTDRQSLALSTVSALVQEVVEKCRVEALKAGYRDDDQGVEAAGAGALAYAQTVGLYLALATDKAADYWSTLCFWHNGAAHLKIVNTFARQALAMTWDFAEANPFSESSGNFFRFVSLISEVIDFMKPAADAVVYQADAQRQKISERKVVSTDPPYYDNIGYSDLSDFFYVWLRRSIRPAFPSLFATVAVPKAEELVANPFRHGSKRNAESFFLGGMTEAMRNISELAHPAFPITIYYAFKQSETKDEVGTSNTGWETFLEAVLAAGLSIHGTWPVRTELTGNLKKGMNALASSVVLVCRHRPSDASTISRREFIRELNSALPLALDEMTRGGVNSPVAPVDLSQSMIGPGMAIFSSYAAVLEADGTPMRVKTALQLINRFLAEDDFDHDSQFCLHWFEQQGWATGKFGEADVLARAKGTSVSGLQATGVVESGKGDLRLLRWGELPRDWSPETDTRLPVWEALHHLIRALNQDGESAAGALLARMPARAEPIRAMAYRLYTLCERKGWSDDARAYNELVTAWSAIEQAAGEAGVIGSQAQLDI
jgi:putative DNA methylase